MPFPLVMAEEGDGAQTAKKLKRNFRNVSADWRVVSSDPFRLSVSSLLLSGVIIRQVSLPNLCSFWLLEPILQPMT